MGGRLAMRFAALHPKRILTLTIASAHPGLLSEKEKQTRFAADAEWAKLLLELPIDEFLKRWYDQPLFRTYKPDFAKRRNQDVSALSRTLMHYSLSKQMRYDLAKAVVLVGQWDEKFRALFENPVIIPNSGHAVHLENPEGTALAIKRRIFP